MADHSALIDLSDLSEIAHLPDVSHVSIKPVWNPLPPLEAESEVISRTAACVYGRFKDFRCFSEKRGAGNGRVLIVGGGASILRSHKRIVEAYNNGTPIWALNCSVGHLRASGVKPSVGLMAHAKDWTDYIDPIEGEEYFLASHLPPKTLEKFLPHKERTFIWYNEFAFRDGPLLSELFDLFYPNKSRVFFDYGNTLGIAAILMAALMGYEVAELHGYDSSYVDGKMHPYPKPVERHDLAGEVEYRNPKTGETRSFKTIPALEYQAQRIMQLVEKISAGEMSVEGKPWSMKLEVHGDGLLPWMAKAAPNEHFYAVHQN